MSNQTPREIEPAKGGFFSELALRLKLVLRLMGDARVSPFLKVIPVGTLVYWIAPDLMPFIPLDDAAVIIGGLALFIEMCPDDVVEEHLNALRRVIPGSWRDAVQGQKNPDDVVDGEYRDVG